MTALTLSIEEGIAFITVDDPDRPQNVLGLDIAPVFDEMLTTISEDKTVTALIFRSATKDCFVAGADIELFKEAADSERAFELSRLLQDMTVRIENLPITTVAAINGSCLGGGVELALAFDYRIASNNPSTRLGLPEVQLGLLPGGSGTQRLPRQIALTAALDMMLTGRQLSAKRAKKLGLIDGVVSENSLMRVAKEYARKPKAKPVSFHGKEKLLRMSLVRKLVLSQARKKTMATTHGNYPAPEKIIDCIEYALENELKPGLEYEAREFSKLIVTPESRRLVDLFFAITEQKKDSGVDSDAEPRDVNNVAVLGAGLMGAGIAYVNINNAKTATRLKDVSADSLAKGVAYIGGILNKKRNKRRLTDAQYLATMGRLTQTIDYSGFEKEDVVIEAVFEDLALKQKMVADVERAAGKYQTIFATNTSAIPIDDIAGNAKHPERVIGMHYFSPVEKMPLLEIVKGSKTADWVTATAVNLGRAQGKTVIVVNDGPGFYTTRILVPYCMEAIRLVLEGVSIERIDSALVKFGFPVGPIKLMDEVGIDVGTKIVKNLNQVFGDRIPLLDGMDILEKDERKGRKNKRGFYDYSGKSKGKKVDESIFELLDISNAGENNMSDQGICDRCTLLMMNEAAYCLEESVLRSAQDGDIGAIFGLGFPPFLGGPFNHMQQLGIAAVVEKLKTLEASNGERFTAASNLKDMVTGDKTFY